MIPRGLLNYNFAGGHISGLCFLCHLYGGGGGGGYAQKTLDMRVLSYDNHGSSSVLFVPVMRQS